MSFKNKEREEKKMPNLNKVFLIGNLTKDVELHYTPSGKAVVNITVAINRRYTVNEEMKEDVAFVPVVLWGKIAEVVNTYCKKGNPLMVEGRIQTRSYQKNEQKIYVVEVIAEHIQLLGQKKEEKTTEQEWLTEEK